MICSKLLLVRFATPFNSNFEDDLGRGSERGPKTAKTCIISNIPLLHPIVQVLLVDYPNRYERSTDPVNIIKRNIQLALSNCERFCVFIKLRKP